MTTYYVSNEASNGYVVGNDSNSGLTKSLPVLTLAQAQTLCTHGDTVYVNGVLFDLGSSGFGMTKNFALLPEVPLRTELKSSNATATLTCTAADSPYEMYVGAFVVTPIDGISGSCSRDVQIASYSGFDATVTLNGLSVISGVNGAINDASVRGITNILNTILDGVIGVQAGIQAINLATTSHKTLLVQGTSCKKTLTASATNTPPINISRTVPATFDMKVKVLDNVIDVDFPTSLGTSCTGRGIGVANCKKAQIARNTVKVRSIGATASDASGISVTSSSTVSIADESIVEDNVVTMNGPAVRGIAIGDGTVTDPGAWATATAYAVGTFRRPVANNGLRYEVTAVSGTGTSGGAEPTWPITPGATVIDNAGANQITWTCRMYQSVANSIVRRNRIFGTFYNGSATPHGISSANVSGGQIYSNYVQGFAVGIIVSLGGGRIVRGNVVYGAFYAPLFAKGTGLTNVIDIIANNTVIVDDRVLGGKVGSYGGIGVAVQGSTNTVNVYIYNNIVKVVFGRGWKYVVVDASQVATFGYNCYHSDGALTLPFSYQGTTYAYTDLWIAARESTAFDLDPGSDIATTFAASNPLLVEKGVAIKNGAQLLDYNGKRFKARPTVGAVEHLGQRIRVAA